MSTQPVRGTRDLLGDDYAKCSYLNRVAFDILAAYGYQGIETPIFEHTSLFQRGLGETSDVVGKEMYTFADRGGDSLTLRPEGTAPVTRAIISAGLTQTLPQKLFYSGPMFRYERPQKGRYRQFYQLGVEYIGSAHPLADVECIALADHLLKAWGISDYQLHLNTLGDLESRQNYRQALVDYFGRYKNDLSPDSQIRLEKNPLRILDSKDANDQVLCQDAPLFDEYLTEDSRHFFDQVQNGLVTLGIDFTRNQKLVRGLDYYCHTAFEFKTNSLGAQDAILAGGRYDGLMQQLGGPVVPAVGWACGLDRLALMLTDFKTPDHLKIALIAAEEGLEPISLKFAQQLRHVCVPCEVFLKGDLSKRLKAADKAGCQVAVLLRPEEYQSNQVKIRYLQQDFSPAGDKETIVSISDLVPHLLSLKKA
ncbi:histidine--tRNA ligase [Candidatus Finniella inopinata]|uniref:Histidine--tRNA ligase n=1 Tax=Candidatus Finniella inopinata TaxID=1696036 RepID=A0A4Q7DNQ9_9PROT|nr:histidine--tRNA ligase [Candidatus Finniella inopinata]RZI46546.1 histidine--tRNA ligase [Candidatus Finniella inopinata]